MTDIAPDPYLVTFSELSRLQELLEEYGETLEEPTNRPLNVIIFQAFHSWDVKEAKLPNHLRLLGKFDYRSEETEWVWLKTGTWLDYIDDHRRHQEGFGLHGESDSDGNFIATPELVSIPDYVGSLDAALRLKAQLSSGTLQLVENDTGLLTSWQALLSVEDDVQTSHQAAIPSVAVVKVVVEQLISLPDRLNWPKFGPGVSDTNVAHNRNSVS